MILLVLLNILYASMFIMSKFALQTGQPVFMIAVRMVLGGLICLAICAHSSKWSLQGLRSVSKQQWGLIGILSFSNIYVCNAFELWGLQYLSAGKTAFIYNLGPFFAALLAYFLFSEKMTMTKWIGLLLGFVGFMPILIGSSDIIDTSVKFGLFSLAEIALMCASMATVIGWTSMRYLLKQYQCSILFLNGMSMFIGGLICLVHAFFLEPAPYIFPEKIYACIGYVVIMAILKGVIGFNLHAYLLTRYTTTFVTFCGFVSSIFAALLGVIFLHETISLHLIIAAGMVLSGLIIFYQAELQQGYVTKK